MSKAILQQKSWRRYVWPTVAALAFIAVVLGYLLQSPAKAILRIGDTEYKLTIVATEAGRERGLSKRKSMEADRGMVFVYDSPQKACMWMKDMQFPIDIVWLDENRKILQVKDAVSPDTYPTLFCSEKPAKYAVELNAGELAKHRVEVGQTVKL